MDHNDSSSKTKTWTVDVSIDEHSKRTRARARLHWRDKELAGLGIARLTRPTATLPRSATNSPSLVHCPTSQINCLPRRRPTYMPSRMSLSCSCTEKL
jgi:hypothetical protein